MSSARRLHLVTDIHAINNIILYWYKLIHLITIYYYLRCIYFFFCHMFIVFFFFFFQAEDGIRDLTVTGVQTCALPISIGQPSRASLRSYEDWDMWLRLARLGCPMVPVARPVSLYRFHAAQMTRDGSRSEERRVGKECRARWSAYHANRIRTTSTRERCA